MAASYRAPLTGERDMADTLQPGLRMLRADNPSPMTLSGTNTYLLGHRALAVIDPGPDDPDHVAAIIAALTPDQSISHIFVTHSHLDHSPAARALSAATGAPVLAYGPSEAGRTDTMVKLAAGGMVGGGEGMDAAFAPDRLLADGEDVAGDGWTLRAHWTPGHMANHMCFHWQEGAALFTGDIVMGWASSLISPPDGDVGQFLDSLDRIDAVGARVLHSGHGDPITAPAERVAWLRANRLERRAKVLTALQGGPQTVAELLPQVYGDVKASLQRAASRNLLAHLVHLVETGHATAVPAVSMDARFELIAR
jgi:glyoxylase-like metal-dependent hydrolase (beta-lactamase superfamily II)